MRIERPRNEAGSWKHFQEPEAHSFCVLELEQAENLVLESVVCVKFVSKGGHNDTDPKHSKKGEQSKFQISS